MLFSKSTLGFYDPKIHGKDVPHDCVEITKERHIELITGQSSGMVISSDENGAPVLLDPPSQSFGDLLAAAKEELRTIRKGMLDAVTGIGFRASVAGNAAISQEAVVISRQLLDITDDPDLNSANTLEDMRSAGLAAYRRIAAAASNDFSTAFKEVTGL